MNIQNKIIYLLNPSGDLKDTEIRIKNFMNKKLWEGVYGSYIDVDKIIDKVKKNYLYLYMGHGSGEKYITK